MSIDIRETKQLNQKKKSDTLGEILGRLEVIEGKIDTLAYDKTSKIDETISYVKRTISRIDDKIYEEADKHMKKISLRVFQISGAIILCAPAVIVTLWWIVSLIAALFV